MPALPWVQQQPIDPQVEYVAMASRLPLTAYRSVPGFLRDAIRIRRQLAHTAGLVGNALDAHLAAKTFWTYSVWVDRASLADFARSEPHHHIIERLKPKMDESLFRYFPIAGSDVSLPWDQVRARLDEALDEALR